MDDIANKVDVYHYVHRVTLIGSPTCLSLIPEANKVNIGSLLLEDFAILDLKNPNIQYYNFIKTLKERYNNLKDIPIHIIEFGVRGIIENTFTDLCYQVPSLCPIYVENIPRNRRNGTSSSDPKKINMTPLTKTINSGVCKDTIETFLQCNESFMLGFGLCESFEEMLNGLKYEEVNSNQYMEDESPLIKPDDDDDDVSVLATTLESKLVVEEDTKKLITKNLNDMQWIKVYREPYHAMINIIENSATMLKKMYNTKTEEAISITKEFIMIPKSYFHEMTQNLWKKIQKYVIAKLPFKLENLYITFHNQKRLNQKYGILDNPTITWDNPELDKTLIQDEDSNEHTVDVLFNIKFTILKKYRKDIKQPIETKGMFVVKKKFE